MSQNNGSTGVSWRTPFKQAMSKLLLDDFVNQPGVRRLVLLDPTAGSGDISAHALLPSPWLMVEAALRATVPIDVILIEQKSATYGKLLENVENWCGTLLPRVADTTEFRADVKSIKVILGDSRKIAVHHLPSVKDAAVFVNDDPNRANDSTLSKELLNYLLSGESFRGFSVLGMNVSGNTGNNGIDEFLVSYLNTLDETVTARGIIPIALATVGDPNHWLYVTLARPIEQPGITLMYKQAFASFAETAQRTNQWSVTLPLIARVPMLSLTMGRWADPATEIWPDARRNPAAQVYLRHVPKKIAAWAYDEVLPPTPPHRRRFIRGERRFNP